MKILHLYIYLKSNKVLQSFLKSFFINSLQLSFVSKKKKYVFLFLAWSHVFFFLFLSIYQGTK